MGSCGGMQQVGLGGDSCQLCECRRSGCPGRSARGRYWGQLPAPVGAPCNAGARGRAYPARVCDLVVRWPD
eukprot:10113451-Lingulodinium_polyedra.AAC.1